MKPDKSKNLETIRGYHNSSNAFVNNEPIKDGNGIRNYHLESDVLFQKGTKEKEKKGIKGPQINYESQFQPQKKGKIKELLEKNFKGHIKKWIQFLKKLLDIKMSQILKID